MFNLPAAEVATTWDLPRALTRVETRRLRNGPIERTSDDDENEVDDDQVEHISPSFSSSSSLYINNTDLVYTHVPHMASDRPGILSTLSLGGRRVSGRSEQPVTHPLLGATASSSSITTSSDNLGEEMQDRTTSDSATGISGAASHTGTGVLPYTPYRPRQRGGTHNQAPVPPSPPLAAASTTSSPAAAIVTATPTSALSASASTSASTAIMTAVPADPLLDAAAAATATSRLQLQSLKAGAQRIGLGNGSMGMGMIDAIFDKGARGRTDAGDWADLLKVLTSSKVG